MRWAALAVLVTLGCAGPVKSPEPFLESVVGIEATGCSLVAALGSGTVLGDRQVVTSAHTVAGADVITVIDAQGRRRTATLQAFDHDIDLAVLEVPELEGPTLRLGHADRDESGWVLAWDPDQGVRAVPMTVTRQIQVTIEDIYVDDIVERSAIEIEAEVGQGDSGGAVITSDGELVGVIYAASRSRDVGFALDHDEIADLLTLAERSTVAVVDSGPCL